MYYPEEIVAEVMHANNIVDVISAYVHLTKKGASYMGLCPFHTEKTASFSVDERKQLYYCFGCGAGGNVFTFLMEYEKMDFQEALAFLAERAGIRLPEEELSGAQKKVLGKKQQILAANKEAAAFFYRTLQSERGRLGKQYLQKRGLSEDTVKKFGLGYAEKYGDSLYRYLRAKGYEKDLLQETGLFVTTDKGACIDCFRNRVIFPILDARQKVIAFGGRVMGSGEPKYLNSPETPVFDKRRNLYGLYLARRSKARRFILCEGYMDVIALHQAGFDCAVASLGTAFTEEQAKLLKRYTESLYLVYDSDGAGEKAIVRAWPILRRYELDALVVKLTPYKDPDEFMKAEGKEAFAARLENAENGFLFKMRVLEKTYTLSRPEEKTRFLRAVAEELLVFSEEAERDTYIRTLAETYRVSYDSLKELVRGAAMRGEIQEDVRRHWEERRGRKQQEKNACVEAEKLLLTWMDERPELFPVISRYIFPEDFSEGVGRLCAKAAYEQLEKQGAVEASLIISAFTDSAEQQQAAAYFGARQAGSIHGRELSRAVKEAIKKVKRNALDTLESKEAAGDMESLQQLIKTRKALENLDKLDWPL